MDIKNKITRSEAEILSKRVQEKRRFMQVVSGPRQVGKTTLVKQVVQQSKKKSHFVTADDQQLGGTAWIASEWELARQLKVELFVIDEVQKIQGWSEVIKKYWDEDTFNNSPMHVVILGSSALLMEQGLTESLAGRFEKIAVPHWSFCELKEAFNFSLDDYIFFGAYPGAAALIDKENNDPRQERWRRYILDSLIDTTLSRDILLLSRIEKPALLKRLFELSCDFSGQILSYQKMIGHLQDVGNTTTLTRYLSLLNSAWLVTGLQKYDKRKYQLRSSIPKLLTYNMALKSAFSGQSHASIKSSPEQWGRWVESAVGAHLLNLSMKFGYKLTYWREKNVEVDFVLETPENLWAIEVKTGEKFKKLSGLELFQKKFKKSRPLVIGSSPSQAMALEDFFINFPAR